MTSQRLYGAFSRSRDNRYQKVMNDESIFIWKFDIYILALQKNNKPILQHGYMIGIYAKYMTI